MNDHIRRGRPGQCAHCGVFRTDGKPPTSHFNRCPNGPDGEEVGVLRTSTYYQTASRSPSRAGDTFEPWRAEQRQRDRQRRSGR